jgi:hypothetical protein
MGESGTEFQRCLGTWLQRMLSIYSTSTHGKATAPPKNRSNIYRYCATPFQVEPVEVTDSLGQKRMYPDLEARHFLVSQDYINRQIGIALEGKEMAALLTRMQLASAVTADGAPPFSLGFGVC